jgi:hypothetical protein
MKKLTLLGGKLALAAAMFLGISSIASATVIDDFSTVQALQEITSGSSTSEVGGPGILGGYRDITITIPAPDGATPTNAARVEVANGVLSVGNDPFVTSVVEVLWNGQGSTGLGAAGDLSDSIAIVVQVLFADLNITIDFELVDTGDNVATASQTILAESGVLSFNLGSFAGDPVDTSALKSIKMTISGPSAYDIVVDMVDTTPIPEPSTMLLSGFALLALGLLRKRAGAKA